LGVTYSKEFLALISGR